MADGVQVVALEDSLFLNTSLKAFKVRAGETATVYDLAYAKRLVSTGAAAFPAGTEDWPQPKAEDDAPPEDPVAAPDADVAGDPVEEPAAPKGKKSKGAATSPA